MSKFKAGAIMTIIIALLFAFFWGGIFSIRIPTDWLFLIVYAVVLIVLILLFCKIQKPVVYISIAVVACVVTLISLIGYKAWNREDFYIDSAEVEQIIYYTEEKEYIIADDEESIEDVVEKINKAYCVKKWDVVKLGELGTPDEYLNVYLKNGEVVSIDEIGCVRYSDRDSTVIYKINLKPEDFYGE